jgi:hypothetical protein
MLLNDHWVTEEVREDIFKFLELNENENIIYQKLWITAKTILREKFIAMSTYTKNQSDLK